MKYIKNGKLVLDGTIRECDLQDKLNNALEIIVDKDVDIVSMELTTNVEDYNENLLFETKLTQEEYELLKEIIG